MMELGFYERIIPIIKMTKSIASATIAQPVTGPNLDA